MPSKTSLVFRTFIGCGAAATLSATLWSAPALAQGELFPRPFVVEHHLVQVDADGGSFAAPPVTDYYGGTWIVSERADGSRVVVDLARREVTEIRPDQGTYSTIGFERLAQVMARATELEGTRSERPVDDATKARRRTAADWSVRESATKANQLVELQGPTAELMKGDGVRYLEIFDHDESAKSGAAPDEPRAKVWTSSTVRLSAAARAAVAAFERDALGTEGLMEAVREHTDGAVPLRTVRPAKAAGGEPIGGSIEDRVVRLEFLESFDRKRIAVPEGLRRVPHTLEGLVAYLEREEQRRRIMTNTADPDTFTDLSSGGEND